MIGLLERRIRELEKTVLVACTPKEQRDEREERFLKEQMKRIAYSILRRKTNRR